MNYLELLLSITTPLTVACSQCTVGQTPWKPYLSKLKNHLKTFKMHQKIVTNLNFVHSLSINDNNSKNMHAKITCEVILL